jgi:hypothetical protein
MDNELKKLNELETKIQELKSALDKERLKAEILNNMIETANKRPGVDIKKINIPPSENTRLSEEPDLG